MPELFRQSRLDDVHAEAGVEMYPTGNSRRTIRLAATIARVAPVGGWPG